MCVCVLAVVLAYELCSYIEGNAYVVVLVKLLIAASISFLIAIAVYGRTTEFKTMKQKILSALRS